MFMKCSFYRMFEQQPAQAMWDFNEMLNLYSKYHNQWYKSCEMGLENMSLSTSNIESVCIVNSQENSYHILSMMR